MSAMYLYSQICSENSLNNNFQKILSFLRGKLLVHMSVDHLPIPISDIKMYDLGCGILLSYTLLVGYFISKETRVHGKID